VSDRTDPLSAAAVVQAAASVLIDAALRLIEADPHQWSPRPCATCQAVSAIVGRRFGCNAKGKP
jgi:hypothetical protein